MSCTLWGVCLIVVPLSGRRQCRDFAAMATGFYMNYNSGQWDVSVVCCGFFFFSGVKFRFLRPTVNKTWAFWLLSGHWEMGRTCHFASSGECLVTNALPSLGSVYVCVRARACACVCFSNASMSLLSKQIRNRPLSSPSNSSRRDWKRQEIVE